MGVGVGVVGGVHVAGDEQVVVGVDYGDASGGGADGDVVFDA